MKMDQNIKNIFFYYGTINLPYALKHSTKSEIRIHIQCIWIHSVVYNICSEYPNLDGHEPLLPAVDVVGPLVEVAAHLRRLRVPLLLLREVRCLAGAFGPAQHL